MTDVEREMSGMSGTAFGYKCRECGKGTVVPRAVPEYDTRVQGNPFTVKNAVIGVCDVCGAQHFSLDEIQRWEREFESEHESLYLKAADIRDLRNRLGLTMEGLAHLIGCTRQSIYNWEREDRKIHQSRMADLMLRLVDAGLRTRQVSVLGFLEDAAKQLGHDLHLVHLEGSSGGAVATMGDHYRDAPPKKACIDLKPVQAVMTAQDPVLRAEIRAALESLSPTQVTSTDSAEYVMRFARGEESLVVSQYRSGKLQVQGKADSLIRVIAEAIISRFNLRCPDAPLDIDEFVRKAVKAETLSRSRAPDVGLPYIGIDESGKGDYFGPLVIAAVGLDQKTQSHLQALGVRDSKRLSDMQCSELSQRIRDICGGRFEVVEIPPERYNSLFAEMQREGQNLNNLLAWGHARALESLLDRFAGKVAIADQFGDERYIKEKLMTRGRSVDLLQRPKAEQYTAVAAASVLARDRFVVRVGQLSEQVGAILPKGASSQVVDVARRLVQRHGPGVLARVAKLHFRTTDLVTQAD